MVYSHRLSYHTWKVISEWLAYILLCSEAKDPLFNAKGASPPKKFMAYMPIHRGGCVAARGHVQTVQSTEILQPFVYLS